MKIIEHLLLNQDDWFTIKIDEHQEIYWQTSSKFVTGTRRLYFLKGELLHFSYTTISEQISKNRYTDGYFNFAFEYPYVNPERFATNKKQFKAKFGIDFYELLPEDFIPYLERRIYENH